jgi:hypothetical protein
MIENVNVTKKINVPTDKVWSAISGIGGLDRWFPVIARCSVEGDGVGAIRTLELVSGGEIRDRIDAINSEARRFVYNRIVHPFPVSKYIGTVEVRDADNRQAEVSWSLEIDVEAEVREETTTFLQKALSDGISGIEQDLRKQLNVG